MWSVVSAGIPVTSSPRWPILKRCYTREGTSSQSKCDRTQRCDSKEARVNYCTQTQVVEIHGTRKRLTYWDGNQQTETRKNRTEQETTRDAHDPSTQLPNLVVHTATDENLTGENWETFLNLCDKVQDEGEMGFVFAHSTFATVLMCTQRDRSIAQTPCTSLSNRTIICTFPCRGALEELRRYRNLRAQRTPRSWFLHLY